MEKREDSRGYGGVGVEKREGSRRYGGGSEKCGTESEEIGKRQQRYAVGEM